MNRQLTLWEFSLLFGILVALVAGSWLGESQQNLADSVIRLHVIANSDTESDQALKLQIRDEVLAEIQKFYPENPNRAVAEQTLNDHLDSIAQVGQTVADEAGYCYPVTAEITQCYFPTKDYDGFSFPAGEYTALRVVVGDGAGQNWWCVAFPPLCLGATSETVAQATAAGLFTQDEAALITESSEGYVLKFKSMELLGEMREWLSS